MCVLPEQSRCWQSVLVYGVGGAVGALGHTVMRDGCWTCVAAVLAFCPGALTAHRVVQPGCGQTALREEGAVTVGLGLLLGCNRVVQPPCHHHVACDAC